VHAALAHGVTVHGAHLAVPSQAGISEKRAHYRVGDHVYAELIDGPTTNWVKASISGPGNEPGTYNVHTWVGPAKRRELHNVSIELLRDARPLERLEQLQRKLEEEVVQKAAEHEQELRRQRKAAETAARQRAQEEAERRAHEQHEAAERAEHERKAMEKVAAEAALQELERAKERERTRRRELRAKWEAVKAAKHKASELREAFDLLSSEAARETKALLEQQAALRGQATAAVEDNADSTIHVVIRSADGRETSIGLARTTPLRVLMHSACRRFNCDAGKTRFTVDGAVISETDTVGRLGLANHDVVKVWPSLGSLSLLQRNDATL